MRKAKVYVKGMEAGILSEENKGTAYTFEYHDGYNGPEVSRTMLPTHKRYTYNTFPPFFEGLLPEGIQLEGLLKLNKIDRNGIVAEQGYDGRWIFCSGVLGAGFMTVVSPCQ